jgi:tRNA (adenine37-N6)-methyltransferase
MIWYRFQPIGILRTPFKEKFGIPRQPGLIPQVEGVLELLPPFADPAAVEGLDGYSHLWVEFVFHRHLGQGWQPRVRPPRLGGNRRVGVFASRSPFRPNPLGLSLLELREVQADGRGVRLRLGGVDLLDGTPVLDIKPYLPYVEGLPKARGGIAPEAPPAALGVRFLEAAEQALGARSDGDRLRGILVALLAADPRPAYVGAERSERVYGIRLYDFDLRFRVRDGVAEVLALADPATEPDVGGGVGGEGS